MFQNKESELWTTLYKFISDKSVEQIVNKMDEIHEWIYEATN